MKPIYIIKIGGSCLTYKKEGIAEVQLPFLNDAARAIKDVLKTKKIKMIIIHGGGSVTHPLLDKYAVANKLKTGKLKNEKDRLAAARIHWAMNSLNKKVVKKLLDEDIPAWPMQTSALFSAIDRKNKNLSMETITLALKNGYVPVLHGDIVLNQERVVSICSGDYVATILAKKTNAKKILFASDVDGVFTKDPNNSTNAKLVEYIKRGEYDKYFKSKPLKRDHSGGMKSKVDHIKQYCPDIEAVIFNGLKKGNLKKALFGEKLGTSINFSK